MDSARIQKLQKEIEVPHLIENPIDLFYLTGLQMSKGRLLVFKEKASLFVDGRYFESVKDKAPCEVFPLEEFQKLKLEKMSFDSSFSTYDTYLSLKKECKGCSIEPVSALVPKIRMQKETKEIQTLNAAHNLTLKGIEHVRSLLTEGITEEALAWEFEKFCREKGAMGLSFEPIIAFGPNSAYPHYRAGKTRLKKGDVVLVDAGAVIDHYAGDLTRIFYFGDPDPRIIELEKIVKEAFKKALFRVKPNVSAGLLDQVARDVFDKAKLSFLPNVNVKQLYMHGLGHGIGLETHEDPRLSIHGKDKDLILKENMVFTIEPGLYVPGVGGVRFEEMIVVTEHGGEVLG